MKNQDFNQIVNLCCLKFPFFRKVLQRKQLILPITILAIFSLMMMAFRPLQLESTPDGEPSPRDYVSFAYDEESNQIILFGGGTKLDQYNHVDKETWAYDVEENKWTNMKPAPKPRNMAAATMAYDSESDRVILFGGCLGQRVWNETWAYDYNTNTWTKMSDGPEGLMGPRMVYDEGSDKMILFGGVDYETFSFYHDTWVYDYNSDTWTDMQPEEHPPGLNYQAMSYDTVADRVLVSAMHPVNGIPSDVYNLWAYDYDSNTWEDLSSNNTEPLSRVYSAMAYDVESDRSIMFGGLNFMSGYVYDDTWAYNSSIDSWQEMQPVNTPGNIAKHFMVYVSSNDLVYLFGGDLCTDVCQLSNELWTYDINTNTWNQIEPIN